MNADLHPDITSLLKMRISDDIQQAAAELILKGKSLAVALRHARAQIARDLRLAAFISLDERIDEGDFSLYEMVAAADPVDFFEHIQKSKTHQFNHQTEKVFTPLGNSAAALGRGLNRTARRGQQIVKKQIDIARGEQQFGVGGKGQGGLFGFAGEVAK